MSTKTVYNIGRSKKEGNNMRNAETAREEMLSAYTALEDARIAFNANHPSFDDLNPNDPVYAMNALYNAAQDAMNSGNEAVGAAEYCEDVAARLPDDNTTRVILTMGEAVAAAKADVLKSRDEQIDSAAAYAGRVWDYADQIAKL
jgi:hypothetical protein